MKIIKNEKHSNQSNTPSIHIIYASKQFIKICRRLLDAQKRFIFVDHNDENKGKEI